MTSIIQGPYVDMTVMEPSQEVSRNSDRPSRWTLNSATILSYRMCYISTWLSILHEYKHESDSFPECLALHF